METVTLLLAGVVTLIIVFLTNKYTYWKRRNVPGPTPLPILGNYGEFLTFRLSIGETIQKIYQQFPNEPFVGAYYGTEPVLIPRDPDMLKTILVKEFYHFSGRMLVDHEYRDSISSQNVFAASGDNWKALRQSVNPLFSSAKLKAMFKLVTECAKQYDTYLDLKYKQSDIQNMKDITSNFTLEVIGSCFFGMNFETLTLDDNTIRTYANKILEIDTMKFCKNNVREIWPTLFFIFQNTSPGLDGDLGAFFFDLSKKSFDSRDNKPIGRNDLVDFLLKIKEHGFIEADGVRDADGQSKRVVLEASDALLASQIFIFFAAGFETSSSTSSYLYFELGKNPKIQQKILDEMETVLKKYDNEMTYEAVQEMKYFEMCVLEVLRKYPLLGLITRECMSDYKFPEYGLKVEKGMRIHIPVWAIHHDPKYYPQPEKFDPERFSPEEVQKRPAYTFLGFGEGHRICVGLRLAKLQVAAGLITVLRKFRIEHCSEVPEPLQFEPRAPVTIPVTQLQIRLVPRNI